VDKHTADRARKVHALPTKATGGQPYQEKSTGGKVPPVKNSMDQLGKVLKAMPKNQGTKSQLKGKRASGGLKINPPEDTTTTLEDGAGATGPLTESEV
jgi:hypothetical protein